MNKWDGRFLAVANQVKTWSKDPSTQVGAVIVKDNRIVSTGFNGFPPGIADDERLNDRPTKYGLVVHAELNAILNAAKNGVALDGTTMYLDGLCMCRDCAKAVASVGIKRVVMKESVKADHWTESLKEATGILEEVGIDFETT